MRQRLKKLNRGLVLGALLLVGLVIFVSVKEAQFQNSVPSIKELSEGYVQDLLQMNEMPNDALDEKFYLTSAAAEQKSAELEHILQKYWNAETKQTNLSGLDGNSLRKQYGERLESEQFSRVFEVECNILEKDIKVTSDGPNRAKVSLQTDEVFVTFSGAEFSCLFVGDNVLTQTDLEEMFESSNPLEHEGLNRKKAHCSLHMVLELELVQGEWKIISNFSQYWSSSSTIVVDEVPVGGVAGE